MKAIGGLAVDFAAGQLLYFSPLWNDGDIEAARAWWHTYMRLQRRRPSAIARARVQKMQEIWDYVELLYSICPGPMRMRMGRKRIPCNPDRKRRPKTGWLFYFGATVLDPFPTCWRRG